MATEIYVAADDTWEFYHKFNSRLKKEMILIAQNDETEYSVYMTDEDDLPKFFVCKGDSEPEYEEKGIHEDDCIRTAQRLYRQYLFPVTVNSEKYLHDNEEDVEEEMTVQEMEDEQYQRDDELFLALGDFLEVVMQGNDVVGELSDSEMMDILDSILYMLSSEHGFIIYRPMFLSDPETGMEVYTEFPYDEGYCGSEDDETVGDEAGGWAE